MVIGDNVEEKLVSDTMHEFPPKQKNIEDEDKTRALSYAQKIPEGAINGPLLTYFINTTRDKLAAEIDLATAESESLEKTPDNQQRLDELADSIEKSGHEIKELNSFWEFVSGDEIDQMHDALMADGTGGREPLSTRDRAALQSDYDSARKGAYEQYMKLRSASKAEPNDNTTDLSPEELVSLKARAAQLRGGNSKENKSENKETNLTPDQMRDMNARLGRKPNGNTEHEADDPTDSDDEMVDKSEIETAEDVQRRIEEKMSELMVGRRLNSALEKYAQCQADLETKGVVDAKGWQIYSKRGRRKRELAAEDAYARLAEKKIAYAKKLVELRRDEGLYDGTDDEIAQKMSDDMMFEASVLGQTAEQSVDDERGSRKEKRNGGLKALTVFGKFMTGSKGSGWFRNAATGAIAGGAVALGSVLTGAGWPITLIAGVAARQAARYGATTHLLDENLKKENRSVVMTSDEVKVFVEKLQAEGLSRDEQMRRVMDENFNRIRTRGDEELSEARQKANKHVRQFVTGYAAGGVAVHVVDFIGHNFVANATSGGHTSPNSNGTTVGEHNTLNNDVPGNDPNTDGAIELRHHAVPHGVENPGQTFEFPAGASHITTGEGWYHQFVDMGMTQEQAQQIFNDPDVMNKLVDQGVAYVDNSSTIGGYGIRMPIGAELPSQSMDTIKQAMLAKGFIK